MKVNSSQPSFGLRLYEYGSLAWFIAIFFVYCGYKRGSLTGVAAAAILMLMVFIVVACWLRFTKMIHGRTESTQETASRMIAAWKALSIAIGSVILIALGVLTFAYPVAHMPLLSVYAAASFRILAIFTVYAAAVVSFHSIGRELFTLLKLPFENDLDGWLYTIVFGIIATALFFYGAALLGQLTLLSLIVYGGFVLVAFVHSGFRSFVAALKKNVSYSFSIDVGSWTVQKTLMILWVAIFLAIVFVSVAGYHPINSDDIRTYYMVPQTYVDKGSVVVFPYDPFNNAPHAFAYIYAPIILLSPSYLNHIGSLFFILALLALYALGRRWFEERIALFSTFLFFTIPWTFWFLMTVKVDFFVAFLITIAAGALLRYFENKRLTWLVASGAIIGFAVAVKYTALLVVPGICIMLLIDALVKRRGLRRWFIEICIVCISVVGAYAPWGLRALMLWGNPLYPFTLSGEMQLYTLSDPTARQIMERFTLLVIRTGSLLNRSFPWWQNLWYMGINKSAYVANEIGPIFLGLLPLMLRKPGSKNRSVVFFCASMIMITLAIWLFVVTSQIWYIMYIFPIWCLLIGTYIFEIRITFVRTAVVCIIVTMAILQLNTSRLFFTRILAGAMSPRDYIHIYGGSRVALADYFNDVVLPDNPDYLVLPMGQQRQILFKDSYKHIYGYNQALGQWVAFAASGRDTAAIRDELRSRGVTHIFYVRSDMEQFEDVWCTNQASQLENCRDLRWILDLFDTFAAELPVVAEDEDWIIYAL